MGNNATGLGATPEKIDRNTRVMQIRRVAQGLSDRFAELAAEGISEVALYAGETQFHCDQSVRFKESEAVTDYVTTPMVWALDYFASRDPE